MAPLTGKIALVTGAGSGIGAAIAERFAAVDAHVSATDMNEAAAEETAHRIQAAGGSAEAFALDVTCEDAVRDAASTVHSRHGRVDVLVNNAGIGPVGTILQATGDDLDRL